MRRNTCSHQSERDFTSGDITDLAAAAAAAAEATVADR